MWDLQDCGMGKLSEAGFMGFIGFMGLGNCLNRGLSRITQMTRIIGGVMVVGGRELSEAGFTGF